MSLFYHLRQKEKKLYYIRRGNMSPQTKLIKRKEENQERESKFRSKKSFCTCTSQSYKKSY